MKEITWVKTSNGYSTTEPKWGAIIELHTDKTLADSDLDRFLDNFYSMNKEPLKRGGHYSLFPSGLDW
jgi:hypothetical protein